MITEWIDSWRNHLLERLNNPILGPFTVAWLIWNWRMVTVLLFSTRTVEERIIYIDEKFTNIVDMLVVPGIFALLFSLVMPWISLFIQNIQDGAINRRKNNKLTSDTNYLKSSVTYAQAQAELNRILAKDEITRAQQAEIESVKNELRQQQETAEAEIALREAEFAKKLSEYQENNQLDEHASNERKRELEILKNELLKAHAAARAETDAVKRDLEKKQKELEHRIEQSDNFVYSDKELENYLKGRSFKLFFNPEVGPSKSKTIVFGKTGKILTGYNANESSWRVKNGQLEIIQSDGNVHSRFRYFPKNKILLHTNDEDTKSIKGQYIIPE